MEIVQNYSDYTQNLSSSAASSRLDHLAYNANTARLTNPPKQADATPLDLGRYTYPKKGGLTIMTTTFPKSGERAEVAKEKSNVRVYRPKHAHQMGNLIQLTIQDRLEDLTGGNERPHLLKKYRKHVDEEMLKTHGIGVGNELYVQSRRNAKRAVEKLNFGDIENVVWFNELPLYALLDTRERVTSLMNDAEVDQFLKAHDFEDVNSFIATYYENPERIVGEQGIFTVQDLFPDQPQKMNRPAAKVMDLLRFYAAGRSENLNLRPSFHAEKNKVLPELHRKAEVVVARPDIFGVRVAKNRPDLVELLKNIKETVRGHSFLPLPLLDFSQYPAGLMDMLVTLSDELLTGGAIEQIIIGEIKANTMRPHYRGSLPNESGSEYMQRQNTHEAIRKQRRKAHLIHDVSHTVDTVAEFFTGIQRFKETHLKGKSHWRHMYETTSQMRNLLSAKVEVVGVMVDWHILDSKGEFIPRDQFTLPQSEVEKITSDEVQKGVSSRALLRAMKLTQRYLEEGKQIS